MVTALLPDTGSLCPTTDYLQKAARQALLHHAGQTGAVRGCVYELQQTPSSLPSTLGLFILQVFVIA